VKVGRLRGALVLAVAALWCLAIAGRLVALQVVDHDRYTRRAAQQQQRVEELAPARGTLYDAAGRELAVSVEVDSAWADPEEVADPGATARAIASVLPAVDADELAAELAEATAQGRAFAWVARKLDPPKAEALAALRLPGILFQTESKRYYPNRELAAAVLGYVGTDNEGLAGLEHSYDDRITGRAGRRTVLRDARRVRAVHPRLAFAIPEPGHDLYLTLDATVQHIVERELARAVESGHARRGTAVVLDPETGAVLAMASYPGFDPNRFADFPQSSWRNLAIADAYEPGSTFKMVTAAAALGAGLIDPGDVLDCEMGAINLSGTRIRDHKRFGLLTFREVIARSSNVGAIKTGLRVGPERLYATIRGFGFGQRSGIDLPGESPGLLQRVDRWWALSTAYISFGQEISITPLQLAGAFGAVANGGTLYRPYVVAAAGTPEGERIERPGPRVAGHPLTEGTAREVERLLEAVVAEGTGKAAAIPGYPVAGKTGTAQKALPGGGYAASKFVASFVGFAPARRPRVVAAVVIDEPWPHYHGGQVAAPAFRAMVEPILLYLGVEPDREGAPRWQGGDDRLPGVVLAALPGDGGPPAPAAAAVAAAAEETW
jgi:cell division protein FtsI (penicillin-binding protein 3)